MIRFGKGERSSSGDSISWGSGPVLSIDIFPQLEDVKSDGGLLALSSEDFRVRLQSAEIVEDILLPDATADGGLRALSSEDFMVRLQSAEIVEDVLLPDIAATASSALKAEKSPTTSDRAPESYHREGQDNIVKLTYKLERISTGDEIVPLDEHIRVSSGDWPDYLDSEPIKLAPMPPSLIFPTFPVDTAIVQRSEQRYEPPTPNDIQCSEHQPMKKPRSMQSTRLPPHPPTTSSPASSRYRTEPMPSSAQVNVATADRKKSSTSKKVRKRKPRTRPPRLLDMTRAVEKRDDDILFGRGGGVNTHPGNVEFRKKALEYLPWYMQSSKEEKERIASLLVESVKSEGHRFLEQPVKGKDAPWHEVIRGEHTKACATFRDLKDGMMKKKKNSPAK